MVKVFMTFLNPPPIIDTLDIVVTPATACRLALAVAQDRGNE